MIKKIVVMLLCTFAMVCLSCAKSMYEDTLVTILTEYIDGKETGRSMQLELHLMKMDDGTRWNMNVITINNDDSEKVTTMSTNNASSNENTDLPWISDLKWKPSKSITCVFLADGANEIALEAEKISDKKYRWDVKCVGKIKVRADEGKIKRWEWKTTDAIKVKYGEIALPRMYRK